MPLMAHKQNGFKSAETGEVEGLIKDGWEICLDPMEFKRSAWGIGVKVETQTVIEVTQEPKQVVQEPEPIAIIEEPAIINAEVTERKRPGRPRKAVEENVEQSSEIL